MKIVLATLVLGPMLLVSGCKQKSSPPPPPPPSPVIGEWACTTRIETGNAKIDAVYAADGTFSAKIAVNANIKDKRVFSKAAVTGTWSTRGQVFAQTLGEVTVLASTVNGEKRPDNNSSSLVRSLALAAKDHAIATLDAAEFVYTTKVGVVSCKR
jgi:hypothetical protein